MELWICAIVAAAALYIAARLVLRHYFPPDAK